MPNIVELYLCRYWILYKYSSFFCFLYFEVDFYLNVSIWCSFNWLPVKSILPIHILSPGGNKKEPVMGGQEELVPGEVVGQGRKKENGAS